MAEPSTKPDGKRRTKRKENARFIGNPHIVFATKTDYRIPLPRIRATFPEPLPPYLPRSVKLPHIAPPSRDPASANAGRFSLSLKGVRRELRKSGVRAQHLVLDVEDEMVTWLRDGGTVLAPDAVDPNALHLPGIPLRCTEYIREVSRTPLQLIWSITDDPFARYVVHCCARYHEIISFSKETSGMRLTYLLRPNVTRPDFRATAALDSPPVTDLDYYSSQIDTESDFISDRETRSDAGESDPEPHPRGPLSVISEALAPSSRRSYSPLGDEPWSISGGSDAEGDKSGSEMELAGETDIHSVRENIVQESSLDSRPHAEPRIVMRNRIWHPCQGRSASSPSRSPARISRRIHVRVDPPRPSKTLPPSFYNYVFA